MRATLKYFWVVAALMVLQVGLGAVTAHYGVEGSGFYGIPLAQWLPYAVTRTWHTQLGIFWIATAWLATGLFMAPAVSGHEPKFQRLGVNVLFVCLLVIVLGSMAGQWPVGLMQAWASVTHGMWYARSAEFLQTDLMDRLRWLRLIGDTIFAIGIVGLGGIRAGAEDRLVGCRRGLGSAEAGGSAAGAGVAGQVTSRENTVALVRQCPSREMQVNHFRLPVDSSTPAEAPARQPSCRERTPCRSRRCHTRATPEERHGGRSLQNVTAQRLLQVYVAAVLLAFLGSSTANANAGEYPNLIVVLIDDLGWGDFSCFGNTAVKTEHIDRLADEGLRFSQFYVNMPICSPSRVALTTGQYPQRWRITSFLSNRADNDRRGMAQWLDPAAPTLARSLKQAGYATGHFGKWHMGGQRDVGEAPLIAEYGFDASLTNFEGLGPRVLPLCDAHDGNRPRKHALGSDNLGRGPIVWQDRAKVTESFTSAAIEFIKQAVEEDRPFYVNLWPDDVHSPFFPPAARRGDGAKRTLYLGVLDTMDEQLGALFDFVRGHDQLRDNTLILVCSDNGPEPGAGSAGPFRGAKGALYEGGVRSPLVVWGPGFIPVNKTGQRNDQSVLCAIDLVPSLLALAKVAAPADVAFDGENLADTLIGKSEASRQAPIFWRRPPDRKSWDRSGVPLQPDLAVREGDWKLVCQYDGARPELYDLSRDPSETTNLAASRPQAVERLSAMLLAWHQSMPPDKGATYQVAPAGSRQ